MKLIYENTGVEAKVNDVVMNIDSRYMLVITSIKSPSINDNGMLNDDGVVTAKCPYGRRDDVYVPDSIGAKFFREIDARIFKYRRMVIRGARDRYIGFFHTWVEARDVDGMAYLAAVVEDAEGKVETVHHSKITFLEG